MIHHLGAQLTLTDGNVVTLEDCIDGLAFVRFDHLVETQCRGVSLGMNHRCWVPAPGWLRHRDRDGALVGFVYPEDPQKISA